MNNPVDLPPMSPELIARFNALEIEIKKHTNKLGIEAIVAFVSGLVLLNIPRELIIELVDCSIAADREFKAAQASMVS